MSRTLQAVGNEGNPNKVSDFARAVGLGTALKLGAMTLISAVASNTLALGDGQRALAVLRCFVTAGAVTGAFTPVASAAPATGEVGISVTGNIVFNAADAVTAVEVTYLVAEGNTISVTERANAAGLVTLPNSARARILVSATMNGAARTVVARAAAPAAGQAAISLLGTGVQFNVADANGTAVITYVEIPADPVLERLLGSVDF